MSSALNSVSALESSSNSPSNTSLGSSAAVPPPVPPPLANNPPNVEHDPLDVDLHRLIMQARIANRLRAIKGTLPPSIVPQQTLPNLRLLAFHPQEVVLRDPPVATEIASGDTEVAVENLDSACHTQPYTSKSLQWIRPNPKRRAKQATEKAEEVKNLKLVQELIEWWKGARAELRTPKCLSAEMEGEELVPDWAISKRNSILKMHVGQDSWELYRAFLLPRDQATLVPSSHTRIEEHHAHVLTQAMAFGHHLSLKCSYWRKEKFASDAKLVEALKKFEEGNSSRVAAEERVKQLEAQLEDLTFRSHIKVDTARTVALEAGRKEGFSAGHEAGKEEGLSAWP
ncbi:hypothetical protein Salat_1484500 [Sesamum alatum]|uniref:Uncharacterized protein n=1 Tax=Sesamum alatum TaxID=300844 RepID=A0AAE1YC95_9LAMI|nr:hypothetical protein Salat_1484500 [Sesamum alatum]